KSYLDVAIKGGLCESLLRLKHGLVIRHNRLSMEHTTKTVLLERSRIIVGAGAGGPRPVSFPESIHKSPHELFCRRCRLKSQSKALSMPLLWKGWRFLKRWKSGFLVHLCKAQEGCGFKCAQDHIGPILGRGSGAIRIVLAALAPACPR